MKKRQEERKLKKRKRYLDRMYKFLTFSGITFLMCPLYLFILAEKQSDIENFRAIVGRSGVFFIVLGLILLVEIPYLKQISVSGRVARRNSTRKVIFDICPPIYTIVSPILLTDLAIFKDFPLFFYIFFSYGTFKIVYSIWLSILWGTTLFLDRIKDGEKRTTIIFMVIGTVISFIALFK
ncbi:hypothetical protein [Enterococcus wangshanyuanii]|uniref:Yip1 domain-containing protein n=1 Tax=Enterococcus wangshanyuanii TaxID=2005703 RepID=A0ABQ1NQX6_9ENTE|nr:hypothetical protein [Enterococcus wangshanyuanii]GGC77851.1 hypothetical protein GCM10011573_04370 [Enterococcus wangshanyuanii]